ncbi:MAG TPA: ATP synthase F0 subunit B [Moorella mulderi]|nr:ATP synthase F0 subunit B [Moorella mulderi]
MPILKALNFDLWTFGFQVINLLVVMGFLYYILWKPLMRTMTSREEKIQGDLQAAGEARRKAEELLAAYREQIQKAHQEAQAIVDQARKAAEEVRRQILAQAEEEAQGILKRTREKIEEEKRQALAAIRAEAADLVVLAASKVIARTLTPEDHETLIREALTEVEKVW